MRRHARQRLAFALAVAMLHLAWLSWWLQGDRRPGAEPAAAPRVAVRLIASPLPPPAPPRDLARVSPPSRDSSARRRAVAPPARQPDAAPTAAPAPQAITAAVLPEPPASQAVAEPLPSLMDGEATRRAIRAAAHAPGLAAQAGRQGPALQTPDARLGAQVQRSAKGDCLKGEYFGGGMGLLSLPFLATAALREQCRR